MKLRSCKLFESFNLRPRPFVEEASRVDEHIARILDRLTGEQIFHHNVPSSFLVIPYCLLDFMVQLGELFQFVLVEKF